MADVRHHALVFLATFMLTVAIPKQESIKVPGYITGSPTFPGWPNTMLAYPADAGPDKKYPLIAFAHGVGTLPETYYNQGMLQELSDRGYIVLAPMSCYRRGFGIRNGGWCGEFYKDQRHVIQWAFEHRYDSPHAGVLGIDWTKKVGLFGHSMGAAATLINSAGWQGFSSSSNCVDNAVFHDKFGAVCQNFAGKNCSAAYKDDAYDKESIGELLLNCPKSCGICAKELCPWLDGPTSKANEFECGNGGRCVGQDCCSQWGGRTRCPPETPFMCNSATCTSGQHCCSSKRECTGFGGPRLCEAEAGRLGAAVALNAYAFDGADSTLGSASTVPTMYVTGDQDYQYQSHYVKQMFERTPNTVSKVLADLVYGTHTNLVSDRVFAGYLGDFFDCHLKFHPTSCSAIYGAVPVPGRYALCHNPVYAMSTCLAHRQATPQVPVFTQEFFPYLQGHAIESKKAVITHWPDPLPKVQKQSQFIKNRSLLKAHPISLAKVTLRRGNVTLHAL